MAPQEWYDMFTISINTHIVIHDPGGFRTFLVQFKEGVANLV